MNNPYHHHLWQHNPALIQLLGLCPMLAVSNSVVNALGMGMGIVAVLTCSNLAVSLIRHQLNTLIRLPAFVIIIAALTTCVQLSMQALAFELHEILGIFMPLIAANCAVISRAEVFASKNPPLRSAIDGFITGMGLLIPLVILGAIRELLGQGTLFANMELLLGEHFANSEILLFEHLHFLFALFPSGAFIGLGLLIAGKNVIDTRYKAMKPATKEKVVAGSKRVRTTGTIS